MSKITKETLNVLRLSLSMMILFTAVLSHEFITEPLIHGMAHAGIGGIQDKDGYLSLCIVYFFNTISCFFAPYVVSRISGKWSMVVGMSGLALYQASFIFPSRISILTTSALVGVAATLLWVGQGQYISENVSDKNREKNTSMQWAIYKMSLIYGGVFFLFYFQSSSIESIVTNGQVQTFMIVFMICSGVSLINTCLLSQSEMTQKRKIQPFFQTTVNCMKLLRTRRMSCLALFFFYTGFVRSFWISIYPSCIKFTTQLSSNTTSLLTFGMIVTGCGQVCGSVLVTVLGEKVRKIGQHRLVISAIILHMTLFFIIFLTFPNDAPLGHTDNLGPVFPPSVLLSMVVSWLLGFGDAILQTQIYSYTAQYYQKESSSVFSIYRFSSGVASTIMFFGAQYFPLIYHLSILTISAITAAVSIMSFRRINRHNEKQKAPITVISVFHPRSSL